MFSSIIKLLPTSILNVPLPKYDNDFTFIVNGKEFLTNRITADLLSPKICKIHFDDPTIKSFTINTKPNKTVYNFLSSKLNNYYLNNKFIPEKNIYEII